MGLVYRDHKEKVEKNPVAEASTVTAQSFANALLATKPGPAREDLILESFLNPANAVPWGWTDVHVSLPGHDVVFTVMNDVLAIGTLDAPLRVPMNPRTAQSIVDAMGAMLPTPRMVDYFSASAPVRIEPVPIGALRGPNGETWKVGEDMKLAQAYIASNAKIEAQRQGRVGLMAGQKKMVVVSNKLTPSQVCIYGWPQLATAGVRDGKPVGSAGYSCAVLRTPATGLCHIQGEYTGHEWSYADYSHGVQPVSKAAFLDGQPVDISTILNDPNIASALNEGGVLTVPRQPGTTTTCAVSSGGSAVCFRPGLPHPELPNNDNAVKWIAGGFAVVFGFMGMRAVARRR